MSYHLITSPDELAAALAPIRGGDVPVAGFDVETNEVVDDRFTPWATETRIAGFSVSYDDPVLGEVDIYCPIRHVPYDWRRRRDLLAKVDEGAWVRRLEEDEGVGPDGWLPGQDPNVAEGPCLEQLAEVLAMQEVLWGAHGWRFDASMLLAEGIEPPWGHLFDTHVDSVFTDPRPLDRWIDGPPGEKGRWFHTGHALKQLGETWLGVPPTEKDLLDVAREVLRCNDWSMLPLRTIVGPYAGKDTRLVLGLRMHVLGRPAYQDEKVRTLIDKHTREIRLAIEMERYGIGVDQESAKAEAARAETETGEILRQANELAGVALPITNGEELANTLYGRLGLPLYRDNRNTRKATLKQVRQRLMRDPDGYLAGPTQMLKADAARMLDLILDYRRAEKELTSFFRPLTYFGDTGRVHTILRPLQAKTTRYSASKPNVQQMPRKGEVRKLFRPKEGHVFLLFDYGQQELRVAAHYARSIPKAFEWRFTWRCTLAKRGDCKGKPPHGPKDDLAACKKVVHAGWRNNWSRAPGHMGLVEGFLTGDRSFDPHQAMVETCKAKGAEVDRNDGKTANFALLYGAGPYKLSETLDVAQEFGKQLHEIFWQHAYPELGRVKDFIDERLRRAGPQLPWSHQEFIRTLHGGRIHLDDGYYGLNYIVQRSCREILLNAILDTAAYLEEAQIPYRQVMPVHDELILEAPADSVDETVVRNIARIMVEAGDASAIPMIVDPGIAEISWGEKSDLPTTWGFNGILDRAEGR